MSNERLEQAVVQVARGLWKTVAPGLGRAGSAAIVGEAASGDHTYRLDELAEEQLEWLVREAGEAHGLRLAYYSEDRGLVEPQGEAAEYVLVVDPIDGTRPAVCGFESCCVSVAAAPMADRVTLGSVEAACLVEIKSGAVLSGRKGEGVYRHLDNDTQPVGALSGKTDLTRMCWAHEICARPSEANALVLGPLIDQSSHAGATFVFNSSSYAISRIVLGQLDAYVDFYGALVQRPGSPWPARSRELFAGKVFGLYPYDIAAAAFLAREAGAFVRLATGGAVDDIDLLDSGETGVLSLMVAANEGLGEQILAELRPNLL